MTLKIFIIILLVAGISLSAYADEDKKPDDNRQVKLDMVSDTVSTAFSKVNAVLQWNMDVTMSPEKGNAPQQYTINAIGQKVPKATAVKSASSLHNDQPL